MGRAALVDDDVVIRPALLGDVEQIRMLALGNGMFAPEDMAGFDDGLLGYLNGSLEGHRWVVASGVGDQLEGAAYYAPEPFGDRVWNLYFLAVDVSRHRQGVGSSLVTHIEQALRAEGDEAARVLIVETSSGDAYEGARGFYGRRGFDREAVIREFYGPGENKIVFWKSLV
jgi:ribosomal protein S18 acetylase RimI-like enzyme